MTQEQFEQLTKKMEDVLVKANQSGKQETSALVDEIFEKIEAKIEPAIKLHVNGKINSLAEKVNTYIEEDIAWKKEVEPYIKNVQDFSGFTKVGSVIMKTLLLMGGAVGVIAAFIKYLKS